MNDNNEEEKDISKRKGRKNYLIQEFDEDVQGKRIPSWIFKHFDLARLVV